MSIHDPMHARQRRRVLHALTGGTALVLGAGGQRLAHAQPYPSRPIKFIVPFPPGSGTDTNARWFAKKIGEATGQSVAVENRPGGNGIIAVQAVLNAPADGYTVFIGSNSTLSTNAATFKKLPYDPLVDFAPISLLSRGPCLIIVPPGSPYGSMAELIDDARKRPGALNYGSGSISYTLYTEWLNEIAKIKTTNVAYKGAGDVVTAIAGGAVDFAVVDAGGAYELARSGKVKALAVTATQRAPVLPDVPTAVEAGLPGYLAWNWVAAAVSAKTPPAIVERLAAVFAQAGAQADTREFFQKLNSELLMAPPDEMRRYQAAEIERWKRLAALSGVELQ